jgi:hypothetical protein
MCVYGESETMSSEELTTKIAKEIQPIVISDQVKFVYGDGNAIFHFDSALKHDEMSIYVGLVFEEFEDLMFTLIPFDGEMSTNMGKDRHNHLLSINNEDKVDNKNTTFESQKPNPYLDMLIDMVKLNNPLITDKQKEDVCNMSLDELLDKINDEGMDSLTSVEKLKLEEYSK